MSSKKRKNDDNVEWSNKETKTKNKNGESLLCIIHSPMVSDHGNFISLDDGKDTPEKKLENLHAIRDRWLLEDADSTKRMQDGCGFDTRKY